MSQGLLPIFPIQDHQTSLLQTAWKKLLDPLLKTASPSQQALPTRSLTAYTNNQLQISDYVLFCNSSTAFTVILPSTASIGKAYVLEKTDSTFNQVTIVSQSDTQIAFGKSTTISTQGETLSILFDGTNWQVLSRYIPSIFTSFPMVITGTITNPTKGTIATDQANWKRVGDVMLVRYDYRQTSAGTAGSGTYLFGLPSGLTIDSTKVQLSAGNVGRGTAGGWAGSGSATVDGDVVAYDTTHVALEYTPTTIGTMSLVSSSGVLALSNAAVSLSFFALVPIVGWKA